ncbi:MAG TPA: tRNA (adenosine(37)-N6)-threonylcarbamoyltransferase complex dimerization subunit type 1 TsaB [Candidatus Binataceae bacterium]|nr:tRNA (adenosine(37)-N6)-threonylcarbamoyltransferase complex dimerization subunit type 1 TsaB [Candidatus Binataceae bacterium]
MTSRDLSRVERLLHEAAAVKPVLGIDTGSPNAYLGLTANGRVIGGAIGRVRSHGAELPGAIDELLRGAGLTARELGAIAVGIGPGSFTGLRIGLSYAKGIALASGCALVGVPSLDALALAALELAKSRDGMLICAVVDARKGEVFAALYRVVSDGLEKVSEDLLIVLEDLASHIAGDVVLAGDSRAKDAAALIGNRGHVVAVLDTSKLDQRGPCIAAIGAAKLARGDIAQAATLEPLYIRPPDAAVKLAAKSGQVRVTEAVWSEETKN